MSPSSIPAHRQSRSSSKSLIFSINSLFSLDRSIFKLLSINLWIRIFMIILMSISSTIFTHFVNEHYFGRLIGSFVDRSHSGIAGDVYLVDKHTIFFHNFSYNGFGSDVYLKAGSTSKPGPDGFIIPDELGRFHKLERYLHQNLLLTLPKQIPANKIRWISIWSKIFSRSLGDLQITNTIEVPEIKSLGPLLHTKNSVSAEKVLAIDDKTLQIKKLYYTINCIYCGFFVGTGTGPNSYRIQIPDENSSFSKLRNYYNEDIVLKLPRDLSLFFLDWFAIYDPNEKLSYGVVMIDKKLNVPPSMAFMLTYVSLFSNCETILPGLMHISWEIRKPDVYFQLEARVASNQYAAFGLSGSLKRSKMIGSDVFIAYYDAESNRVVLEDFTITTKSQCNVKTRTGVCQDRLVGGTNDLDLLMSSYIDGLIKVTFRRSIKTQDRMNDLPVLIHDASNFVVAAIGTLDTEKNPSYHTVALNTKYHRSKYRSINVLNFGRANNRRACQENLWRKVINEPANIFNIIADSQHLSETEIIYDLRPWPAEAIRTRGNYVFRVVIGPAGDPQQGYTSITGNESPSGLAFWINDLLIPELHVIRGHDYTFLIETGDNKTDRRHYHPFYITDSKDGGGSQLPDLLQSPTHRIYAGVIFRDGLADPSPGTGRYCELIETEKVNPTLIYSIEDYRKMLRLHCGKGNIGSFRWRPDDNTPDIVYYQSFTQKNMGWRIKVTSNGIQSMPSRNINILIIMIFIINAVRY
ncbi:rhotekin-like [Sarcoptes scabiei]|nr:rhotekin-like [Sarcoptes scabiei]